MIVLDLKMMIRYQLLTVWDPDSNRTYPGPTLGSSVVPGCEHTRERRINGFQLGDWG